MTKKKKEKIITEEEFGHLVSALEEEKEKALRYQAEMMNYKRRRDEETSYMMKYANEDIILAILPIIDNFERAISLDDNDLTDELSKFLSGFKMLYTSLVDVLNQNEVQEIEADGLEFNPNYHQAVLTEKDQTKPAGVILEVLQKGYLYKDKVIRPSMVKVNE